jgi:4-hydroxybenzoate polyprenyltransferase
LSLPPLLRVLRPHQWSKNVFVLAALVFALGDRTSSLPPAAMARSIAAFFAFSLVASSIYLVNDILDVAGDRAHPIKRKRPIAAGEVAIGVAWVLSFVCLAAGLVLAFLLAGGRAVVQVLLAYTVLNLVYSSWLKHVVLVDAFCIAAGFQLRLMAGGYAAGVGISHWAVLCTLFLALFLALSKRRAELVLMGESGLEHRSSLKNYNVPFLDQMIAVLAACTIVAYTMYTVDPSNAEKFGEGHGLLWTIPFVVFGLGRYMVLTQSGDGGDNPTRIFLGGDAWFLANTLAWVAVVLLAMAN